MIDIASMISRPLATIDVTLVLMVPKATIVGNQLLLNQNLQGHLSPNPPMDRDGRRKDSGRGEGVTGAMIRARIWVDGRLAGGLQALLGAPMAAYSGCGERDGGIGHGKRRSRTGLARVCGDVGLAGGSVADGRRQAGSGMARSRARARLNCSSQGQRRAKMQGQSACRAGDPSGQGKDPSSEGLGGHDLLTQADAGCPAGQVVRHHLYRQPGAVGGEAARGEMVQPHAVLEVAYRILDLGVTAMIGLQFQRLPVPVGDEAVIAVGGEESQLRTGRRLHPPDDEPYRRGVRLGLERGVELVSEVVPRALTSFVQNDIRCEQGLS